MLEINKQLIIELATDLASHNNESVKKSLARIGFDENINCLHYATSKDLIDLGISLDNKQK